MNITLTGWANYYYIINDSKILTQLDKWVRKKLRQYLRKYYNIKDDVHYGVIYNQMKLCSLNYRQKVMKIDRKQRERICK